MLKVYLSSYPVFVVEFDPTKVPDKDRQNILKVRVKASPVFPQQVQH